jgi:hypothetical protein
MSVILVPEETKAGGSWSEAKAQGLSKNKLKQKKAGDVN